MVVGDARGKAIVNMVQRVIAGLILVLISGVPAQAVVIASKHISFGKVQVGWVSAPQTTTFSNPANVELALEIEVTGPFSQTNDCSLPPNSTCQISVSFTPTGVGDAKGKKEKGTLVIKGPVEYFPHKRPIKIQLTGVAVNVSAIFATDESSVTAYPLASKGDVTPIATIAGDDTGLLEAWGIAVDSSGYLYVANNVGPGGTVVVYPPKSNMNASPSATIDVGAFPTGVAVDSSRNLYVTSHEFNTVAIYSPGSSGDDPPIAAIGGDNTGLDGPAGIALDSEGNIYVVNQNAQPEATITVYPAGSNGNVTPAATIAGDSTGLNFPAGIAVDSKGYMYVTNFEGGPLGAGSITIYAPGSNGDVAPSATITGSRTELNEPFFGIAVDSTRKIYVANVASPTGPTTITAYAPGSHGNVRPIYTITGNSTGLTHPLGLAIGPIGP
jgi:hypothetical protein